MRPFTLIAGWLCVPLNLVLLWREPTNDAAAFGLIMGLLALACVWRGLHRSLGRTLRRLADALDS